jgi:hypothetical protein
VAECQIENCLCQSTIQPITEAVYGKKPKKRKVDVPYESRGGTAPLWRIISDDEMTELARKFPKARRFAARRKP